MPELRQLVLYQRELVAMLASPLHKNGIMGEAFDILLQWPTIFWTIPMGLVLGYWALVIVGFLGVDLIPFELDGAADGVDGALEGGADGALVDPLGAQNWFAASLSLGVVPATITLSIWIFCSWAFTFLTATLFGSAVAASLGILPFILVVVGLSFAIGYALTSLAVRPMRKAFVINSVHSGKRLVGKIVTITSSNVSPTFGIAGYKVPMHEGNELILNVVQRGDHAFVMGDEAVVVAYDDDANHYVVAAIPKISADPPAHPAQPTPVSAPAPVASGLEADLPPLPSEPANNLPVSRTQSVQRPSSETNSWIQP